MLESAYIQSNSQWENFSANQLLCEHNLHMKGRKRGASYLHQWVLSQSSREAEDSRASTPAFANKPICHVWQRLLTGPRVSDALSPPVQFFFFFFFFLNLYPVFLFSSFASFSLSVFRPRRKSHTQEIAFQNHNHNHEMFGSYSLYFRGSLHQMSHF